MTALTFDALDYFEKLKNAGVSEDQAKVQVNAFRDFAKSQQEQNARELATKADVMALRSELRETELRLEVKIQAVRTEVQAAENRIRNWLVGTMLALMAVFISGIGVIISYLPK